MALSKNSELTPLQLKALKHVDSLGSIRFPTSIFNRSEVQRNQALAKIAVQYRALILATSDATEIISILSSLEKEYCKHMNAVLASIPLDVSPKKNAYRLDTLALFENALSDMTLDLSENADEVIDTGLRQVGSGVVWNEINTISQNISSELLQEFDMNDESRAKARDILRNGKNLILMNLIKCRNNPQGMALIHQLSTHLNEQNKLYVNLKFSVYADGLAIEPASPNAFAVDDQSKIHSISEFAPEKMVNNSGSASVFILPVPSDDNYDINNILADGNSVRRIMRQMMRGNFYFQGQRTQYTPFQVVLTHELIHVLHNSQGINARVIIIRQEEQKNWSNLEEYLTIDGGAINENQFIGEYGGGPRKSHMAFSSETLFEKSNRNKIATLSAMDRPEHLNNDQKEGFKQYKDAYSTAVRKNPDKKTPGDDEDVSSRNRLDL